MGPTTRGGGGVRRQKGPGRGPTSKDVAESWFQGVTLPGQVSEDLGDLRDRDGKRTDTDRIQAPYVVTRLGRPPRASDLSVNHLFLHIVEDRPPLFARPTSLCLRRHLATRDCSTVTRF